MVTMVSKRLAPSTTRRIYNRASLIFAAAVRDRVMATSPCVDINLPRTRPTAIDEVLTTAQVLKLAEAVPERYRGLIITGAGTGLRPAELFGMVIDRVELLRRALKVDRQLTRVGGRGVELSSLKTRSSDRTLPLPDTVCSELAAHMARYQSHQELGPVFTNEYGRPIQQKPFAAMVETARCVFR
jgi:integrase